MLVRYVSLAGMLLILAKNSWKRSIKLFSVVQYFASNLELSVNRFWKIFSGASFLLLTYTVPLQIWFDRQFLKFQRLLQIFSLNLEQLICKKMLKFALLRHCFPDLFYWFGSFTLKVSQVCFRKFFLKR